MNSNSIKVIVLVAAVAGAGFFFYRSLSGPPESGVDMGQPTYWVCRNEACGKDFEISLSEFAKSKDESGRVKCPACGQMKTQRANKCPSCSRNLELVGHGDLPEVCPHCKANIGEASLHGKQPPTTKSKSKTKVDG